MFLSLMRVQKQKYIHACHMERQSWLLISSFNALITAIFSLPFVQIAGSQRSKLTRGWARLPNLGTPTKEV